jgi:hypothetical protein
VPRLLPPEFLRGLSRCHSRSINIATVATMRRVRNQISGSGSASRRRTRLAVTLQVLASRPTYVGGVERDALTAGIDVELPSTLCYGEPLLDEIEAGRVDESLVDRALRRVLARS